MDFSVIQVWHIKTLTENTANKGRSAAQRVQKNARGPQEQVISHIFDTLYKVPLAKTIRHKT